MTGFIYFIQSERGGPIKIGYATNVQQRLEQLQSAHPYRLLCLASTQGSIGLEHRLHENFDNYRLLGEWFEPCDELLDLIRNIEQFDPLQLPVPKKKLIPMNIDAFVDELYAVALDNDWDYETAAAKFKEELVRHKYSVTHTFKHMRWFEETQRQRFEEKRAVTGLKLDVK